MLATTYVPTCTIPKGRRPQLVDSWAHVCDIVLQRILGAAVDAIAPLDLLHGALQILWFGVSQSGAIQCIAGEASGYILQ
jgi:hypothetical protein